MEVTGGYKLKPGTRAPPFDLEGVDGKRWSLDSFSDKRVLVVAWWCNHCPYVRAWEERTIEWARESRARGVGVVAINSNDVENYPTDDLPHMKQRAAEKGYPFPYLFDETQEVAKAYGAQVTPHYFVFHKAGDAWRLAYQGRFDDSKESPQAVERAYVPEAVESLLRGREAPDSSTPALGCSVKWKG